MTLLLGGSGQLGTAFRRLLPEANAPNHQELDLSDVAAIGARVEALQPNRIINCAGYTAVDAAERNEKEARLINGDAVAELAAVAQHLDIPFVTFSTDYVFDGEAKEPYVEASEPNPINAYGRTKRLGERAALGFPNSLVVRTSWLFSATHPNFVTTILARAAGGAVRVVDDQWGTPTPAPALAKLTLESLENRCTGLLHLAGQPGTTWHELARRTCAAAGIDPGRVIPCHSEAVPLPARRPRFSALATARGVELPSWQHELVRMVGALRRFESAPAHQMEVWQT